MPSAIILGIAKNQCTHIFSVLSPDFLPVNYFKETVLPEMNKNISNNLKLLSLTLK